MSPSSHAVLPPEAPQPVKGGVEPLIVRGPRRPDLMRHEMLPDVFEATAQRLPHKVALIDGASGNTLTYAQLDHAADLVAHHLMTHGVHPGQIVGLWLPRGLELLVMQLGITKAGAAWLPFDADVPTDRIAVCLEDASAAGLVCHSDWAEGLAQEPYVTWRHGELLAEVEGPLTRRAELAPHHPAYVIYTSGSTGKPKGIVIEHANITHFLRSENEVLGVTENDRVYQGFSVAFDMSFEEIWISYLVGATLWVAPKALVSDPDALPRALQDNGITVLHAVPTLLALFSTEVPGLRIINLGGEMCPDALVARFDRPGLQIFNTYGPTEATVSASLALLTRDRPVTIGWPLPNYGMLVLDEQQKPVPPGETGELCIIGPGVAQGYLGRPELTAEKFLPNPWAAHESEHRLYRTGDLARIQDDGAVQCLGRADDQVKIRGFRVELGEIEAALCEQAGVGTAAVLVRKINDIDQLVAWIAPEQNLDDAGQPLPPPAASQLREALKARLPSYMVPVRYEFVDVLPRLLSGKIDRKALKAIELAPAQDSADSDTPDNDAERLLFDVLKGMFPGEALRRDADFFSDLGGHSLFAARLVSLLRADARLASMTVQDVYRNRRLGKIADAMLEHMLGAQETSAPFEPSPHNTLWRRLRCGVFQAMALPVLVFISVMQWLAPFFTYHIFTGSPGDSIWRAMLYSLGVFVLVHLASLLLAVIGRRYVLGRVRPGRYPLWGWMYFRWWLSDRMVNAAPLYLLNGSILMNFYLRAVGVQLGRDVAPGGVLVRVPSLISIGDGVSIGAAVNFENARVERGELVFGRIDIGAESSVGSYCVLEGNTRMGEYSKLEGQSALADGQSVPSGESWLGSPAARVGSYDRSHLPARPPYTFSQAVFETCFYGVNTFLIGMIFFMPLFPTFMFVDWLLPESPFSSFWAQALHYSTLAIPASAILIVFTALLSATVRWLAIPQMEPGRYPVHGSTYYRKWIINQIQDTSLQTLHSVYATVFAPSWYRLLGAKVGKRAEISTAMGVVPDMLTLGDETFIADAVMLGDDDVEGGWMTLRRTTVGHRSFVGNGAYVPDGSVIPPNVLIGVQSRAPESARMKPGDTWFGTPPIQLPAREVVTGFDEDTTFHPGFARMTGRTLVESFRIVVPLAYSVGVGYAIVNSVMPYVGNEDWAGMFWHLAMSGALYGLGSMVFVLLLKWIFIGRYKPSAHPMWTPFVWFSEAVTNMYESMAVMSFLNYLRGTPMLPWALRLYGAKVGKYVYLDTTDMTEYDCVTVGDHAELNNLCGPQTHLFEDRIMKIGNVVIERGANIRARCTVLYDATLGEGAMLGPLTLVMKGENIPPNSDWCGSPAAPWKAAAEQ
ncbi:Pls/PosA family non-ribosomal peptide synthetase [Brachymonas sp. M4Q-1]|uniref:Pls/PosA family non-ribosomal peptide synthetase n=1 Tax=Brachymonas sp. M4Q-1 TaxID=3416906 RepID=UPI003CF1E3C5